MSKKSPLKRVQTIGVLTSGGDCPGLNAVLRAIVRGVGMEGVEVFGFFEGFTGLVENRYLKLEPSETAGLLTLGGTILRTSRNKPNKMPAPNGNVRDMTGAAVETYRRLNLDCLVCLGGGGTQKGAYHLMTKGGLNVVTVPKTIDNDVYGTDVCFGYDTGMSIAAEAIDRLHTTASSHHRVMVVDIMGHNAGWLALGAGVAGGADVILIPEIPYSMDVVAQSLLDRMRQGKMFSIVAMAEGAVPRTAIPKKHDAKDKKNGAKKNGAGGHYKEPVSAILAEHLEQATRLETRVTSLGHLQRGGIPTPADRILCTEFGTHAAECVLRRRFGVMIAKRGEAFVPVPLKDVVGKRRIVSPDHPLLLAARSVGTCLGDVWEGYPIVVKRFPQGALS
ncbi:MAG TPA: ATP-dependent 6-phosphofructokinase [Candidatus Hydrogenedentes bacterium]|nr:ATP-dependent 6-phosphofructokinase [Candidatus Hydrogenedentota bacterium]HOS02864.1 ATP-dependent 6-phosphofructokinase [Candidatus Hydrogenedentota bacterium]